MKAIAGAVSLALLVCHAEVASAQNLLPNPGFDTDLSGWELSGSPVWSSADADGSVDSGSAATSMFSSAGISLRTCVPITPGHLYSAGVAVKARGSGVGVIPTAGIRVDWRADAACSVPVTGTSIEVGSNSLFTWKRLLGGGRAPHGSTHAAVELFLKELFQEPGSVIGNLDDAYLGAYQEPPTTTITIDFAAADCSDAAAPYGVITVGDALMILKSAVGIIACDLCVCDTDASQDVTGTDALRTLRHAVGIPDIVNCGAPCGS